MNPFHSFRPSMEGMRTLLPRVKPDRPRQSFYLLMGMRLLQVLICLYSLNAMAQFEMFTLFEINCGPAVPVNQIENGRIERRASPDANFNGPNLAYEQLKLEQLDDLQRQHWLFHKREQRTFGFLTATGRKPSADSRIFQIKNWMHLPYNYYPLLLPNSCDSVPKIIQFKLMMRKLADAKKQKETDNNQKDKTKPKEVADVSAKNDTDSATVECEKDQKCEVKEVKDSQTDSDDDSNEIPSPEPDIQVIESNVGDYFQTFARFLKVSGTCSIMALLVYCFWSNAYHQNSWFLMGTDLFASVFMLFAVGFSSCYFNSGVNELYDGMSPMWLIDSSRICDGMTMCRVTSSGNWNVLDEVTFFAIINSLLWLISTVLIVRINSQEAANQAETQTETVCSVSGVVDEKPIEKC